MPFVNVKLVEGVFSSEEKHAMAKALSMSWSGSRDRRRSARWFGF